MHTDTGGAGVGVGQQAGDAAQRWETREHKGKAGEPRDMEREKGVEEKRGDGILVVFNLGKVG